MKEIEFALKNFLLRILLLFNSAKKINSKIALTKNSKVLFIRLNKLGDALVTTPLIKLIKEHTGCHISILADAKNHVVLRVMEFAKVFNLNYDVEKINIHYHLSQKSLLNILTFSENNFANKFLCGINISAGSEARFWGVERFKKVIKVLDKYDLQIVILSTENERRFAEVITDDKYPIFTTPDFNSFAAMISKLNFLFTPDTSIVHLASAYEIPMFGIYVKYNTENMIWSPFKSKFDCVITEEANFKNLEFEQVEEKFKTFIEKIYEQRNTKL